MPGYLMVKGESNLKVYKNHFAPIARRYGAKIIYGTRRIEKKKDR